MEESEEDEERRERLGGCSMLGMVACDCSVWMTPFVAGFELVRRLILYFGWLGAFRSGEADRWCAGEDRELRSTLTEMESSSSAGGGGDDVVVWVRS